MTEDTAGAADANGGDPSDGGDASGGGVRVNTDAHGSRDVVVPLRLYKTVTVFSTLIAVVCVVVGFALLDAATLRVSFVRAFLLDVLGLLGVSPADSLLTGVLAVLGLATIAFGAGVYVVGTRFRAEGLGNAQDGDAEH